MSSATDAPPNTSATVGPVITSPTDAINTSSTATAAPPTTAPTVAPATATSPSAQNCCAANGKCDVESSSVGDGTCNQESCKCDASCQCKCNNEGPSKSGKPDNCQSSNPVDCSNGACKLSGPEDPPNVGLVTNGKCLGPALYEGPEQVPCPEGVKKQECQKKRRVSDRERCPLSGECDGSKQDSSVVLWHPSQGSPGGSPRSQTAGDIRHWNFLFESLSRGSGVRVETFTIVVLLVR